MANQDFDFKSWVNDFKSGKLNEDGSMEGFDRAMGLIDINDIKSFEDVVQNIYNTLAYDGFSDDDIQDFVAHLASKVIY
jgi:hypothetical protein